MTRFPMKNPNGKNDECFTPPEIFERLGLNFDLDVAAPAMRIPWIPAKRSLTEADDGLVHPWNGLVWMNPPFSKPLPWITRFIEHGNGVALVPTSTGRWMDLFWAADSAWVLLPPLRFVKPDLTPFQGLFPNRIWSVAMGDIAKSAIGRLGVVR